mmetsp:Transcript_69569/g.193583  ORF Transcript_69569/g.193583 Transcript_69569/m.193583 type:complete len:268 (-) Transcript_69569:69-872(-)
MLAPSHSLSALSAFDQSRSSFHDRSNSGTLGMRMSASGSKVLGSGLKKTASDPSFFSPSVEQRIDSTWALGGRKARALEKKPAAHRLSQFYHAPFDDAYALIAKQRNLRLLQNLFYEADEDGSGMIDMEEFMGSMSNPKIREAFAQLGVQPHHSKLVFKTLDVARRGELTIGEFMDGLHGIVGPLDFRNQASELDTESLRPGRMKRGMAEAPKDVHPTPPLPSAKKKPNTLSLPQMDGGGSKAHSQLHRAFVHSALAQALHPATAKH